MKKKKNTMQTATGQHVAILKSLPVYIFSNIRSSVSKDPGTMSKCPRSAFIIKRATARSLSQAWGQPAVLAASIPGKKQGKQLQQLAES